MIRFLSWLRFRRLSAANRLALDWMRKSHVLRRQLAAHERKLASLVVKIDTLRTQVDRDVQSSEELDRQHQIVIDSLRAENQVLADSTVPALVASHALIIQRYEAETALEVRRSVALRGGGNEE